MALHHDLGQARAKRLANVDAFHTGNVACEVVNVVFLIFLRAPESELFDICYKNQCRVGRSNLDRYMYECMGINNHQHQ